MEEEEEPEITTYSPPIDFKLGTTASDGIEAGDVQYEDNEEDLVPDVAPLADIYDNDYEVSCVSVLVRSGSSSMTCLSVPPSQYPTVIGRTSLFLQEEM